MVLKRDITAVGQQPSVNILADQPPKYVALGLDGFSVFPSELIGMSRVLPEPLCELKYDSETVQRDGTRGVILFNTSLLSQLVEKPHGTQTLRFDFDNGVSFFGTLNYENSYRHDKDYQYRSSKYHRN